MNSVKALQLLNDGRINELKILLQDEIYQDSLDRKTSAKKRYTAMKKYFTYHQSSRECLQKPCVITFEGKEYTSFTNSWSLILTTESCGEIEMFNEENGKYPDVARLIRFDGIKKKFNFTEVLAEAKSKGYRLNKKEVEHTFKYLLLYDGTYYKLGLLDASFSIIDNGETAISYHPDGEKMPLTIKNDIGICMIMPVYLHDGEPDEDKVVIELK